MASRYTLSLNGAKSPRGRVPEYSLMAYRYTLSLRGAKGP